MVKVYDEFTQLKKVILGDVNLDLVEHCAPQDKNYIADILLQTKEDLQDTQKIYEKHNVKVQRPAIEKRYSHEIITPNCSSMGVRNPLSPRDTFIILGTTILENATWKAESIFEYLYYKDIFLNEFQSSNCKWIKMPTPAYAEQTFNNDEISDYEPIMDGSQILRCGKHCFVSITGAGNEKGFDWLERHFPQYKFVRMPSIIQGHIDAQLKIFKPGLIMSPYNKDQLPNCFSNWEHIRSSREFIPTDNISVGQTFRDDDIENTFATCSIVSLNESTVFLYEHFKETHPKFIKDLEQHKIDIIWVPFKNQHWFNQGISCITMEIERQGELENYFL